MRWHVFASPMGPRQSRSRREAQSWGAEIGGGRLWGMKRVLEADRAIGLA